MTYSAEFIVNVGQFEHVKFTVQASDMESLNAKMAGLGSYKTPEIAGDTHASLKAAVLYGRDQAHRALTEPVIIKSDGIDKITSGSGPSVYDQEVTALQEELREELIIQELDSKVLDVQDKSTKPWERPVEAAPVKPWEVVAEQSAKPADDPFADF